MATSRSRSNIGPAMPASGYESPTEENQPPFFFTASAAASGTATPTQASMPIHPVAIPTSLQLYPVRPPYQASLASEKEWSPALTQTPSRRPNLNSVVSDNKNPASPGRVGFRGRIVCYQWTYFTMTMATGGMANVLHGLSYKAEWVTGVGVFFCLLNIVFFLMNCVFLSARFHLSPGSLRKSFTDQVESLFIPAFFVSIGVILITVCQYGAPHCGVWLLITLEIFFWVYLAISAVASAGLYLILWSTMVFPVHTMTPTWVFPAYPLLITAPFAANLIAAAEASSSISSLNAMAIAFSAIAAQGTGCLIALMISAAFIYRLMTQKLPRDVQRPGVFISIGPFAFTAGSIAQLGSQASHIVPSDFLGTTHAVDIIKIMSILAALWLWGLSMWFLLVSVGSLFKYVRSWRGMPFQMTWWSFVFPNTALVTATEIMGSILGSKGIQLFACVMAIILIVVWIAVFATMIRCLKERKILWPKSAV